MRATRLRSYVTPAAQTSCKSSGGSRCGAAALAGAAKTPAAFRLRAPPRPPARPRAGPGNCNPQPRNPPFVPASPATISMRSSATTPHAGPDGSATRASSTLAIMPSCGARSDGADHLLGDCRVDQVLTTVRAPDEAAIEQDPLQILVARPADDRIARPRALYQIPGDGPLLNVRRDVGEGRRDRRRDVLRVGACHPALGGVERAREPHEHVTSVTQDPAGRHVRRERYRAGGFAHGGGQMRRSVRDQLFGEGLSGLEEIAVATPERRERLRQRQ